MSATQSFSLSRLIVSPFSSVFIVSEQLLSTAEGLYSPCHDSSRRLHAPYRMLVYLSSLYLLFVMHAVIVTVTVAVVISAQGLLPKPGTKHFSSFFELIAFI